MRKSCGSLSKVHFAHPFLSSVGQREKCLRRNHCCHQKWNYEWNQQFQEHVVPVAPKHIFAIQCLIQAVILCSRHIFPPCDRKVIQSRPQGSRLTQSATMPGCQPDLTWEKPESQFWGSTYISIHYFITQNYQQCAFTTNIMECDINDGTRSKAW